MNCLINLITQRRNIINSLFVLIQVEIHLQLVTLRRKHKKIIYELGNILK